MIKNGTQPARKDYRDFSFKRTFGAFPARTVFPDELNVDRGFGFPDQNADGYPYGCTGYTQVALCEIEDGTQYQPSYTYNKTLFMEGNFGKQIGCDIRDSLKSTIVYGVLPKTDPQDKDADSKASLYIRGNYFNVIDSWNQTDAFDDVRTVILTGNQSVSVGTPWFPEWENVGADGILSVPSFDLSSASWHNWQILGWKQINNQPYLIGKSWQGPGYGDGGYHYISRELFNKVMGTSGAAAFTVAEAQPGDIKTIKLDIISTILSYCVMWLEKMREQITWTISSEH